MRLSRTFALLSGVALSRGSFQCWQVVRGDALGAAHRPGTLAAAAYMQAFDEPDSGLQSQSFMGGTTGLEGEEAGVRGGKEIPHAVALALGHEPEVLLHGPLQL